MSFLFLFASLGVINGILLSIYLIVRKQRRFTDIYFAGLILMFCIRIGKSVLVYFNESTDRLILQIGLSACLFIGPLFYLYARALQKEETKAKHTDLVLLGLLLITIVTVGSIYPYRTEPEIWNGQIIQSIYAVWGLFLVSGLYQWRKVLAKALIKPVKLSARERYITGIALSVVFITLTYQFALFIKGFTYIWGSLIFSVSFYYLAGRALLSHKPLVPKVNTQPPLENSDMLFEQVESIMLSEKLYINPKLKLDELATKAGMSRHILSRVLNEAYPHGFSQYMKEHRVNEAKRLIQSRDELSLEGIGYEAGFSSKSTFFEAFKKIAGSTPAAYKRSLQQASPLSVSEG